MNQTSTISTTILHMAIPASFGMLLTFLFQLVDTYFIGLLGLPELTAVSFTFPIYMLLVGLFMGVASGTAATVGKALGEKNGKKVQDLSGITLIFMFCSAVLLSLIAVIFVQQTFSLLGASTASIAMIEQYMVPLYWGFPLLVISLISNAVLMADGKMKLATIIMAIGGVLNLIFDYLLIFGVGPFPELGLLGAAVATIVSWLGMTVVFLGVLFRHRILPTGFGFLVNSPLLLREVLIVSVPAIVAQMLIPLAIAFLTRLVASFGDAAVAAFGIATRIESLALTLVVALSVVITPIAAREFGAKSQKNIDQLIAFSGRLTVYWSVFVFVVLAAFCGSISSLFTDNVATTNHIHSYFLIVGLSYPAYGLSLITMALFNGVFRPMTSLKLTIIKSLGLTIPLAFLGSYWGLSGIFIGVALANVGGAVYAFRLLDSWLRTTSSELTPKSPWQDYRHDAIFLFRLVKSKTTKLSS